MSLHGLIWRFFLQGTLMFVVETTNRPKKKKSIKLLYLYH